MLDRCVSEALAGPPELAAAELLLDFLAPPGGFAFMGGRNATGTAVGSSSSRVQPGQPAWSPVPWISARSTEPAAAQDGDGEQVEAAASGAPYGSSLRLILQLPQPAAEAELLRRQHGRCAGCHEPIVPAGRPTGLLGSLGFKGGSRPAGPKRCEYSGQLYCAGCFGHVTAVVPARVLHEWDFKRYPVSALASEYLASIFEQPMLCVGAVNPGLMARVALLAKVHETRVRACKALELARAQGGGGASSAERLLKAAGPRRYLLETHEFWAMRELVELSKGAYSRLPSWLDTVCERASNLAISAIVSPEGSL